MEDYMQVSIPMMDIIYDLADINNNSTTLGDVTMYKTDNILTGVVIQLRDVTSKYSSVLFHELTHVYTYFIE